ncbi:MAG: hypothetical protein LAQ30_01105 [Acidobacteriia bacterium]|nr:hypothetical protein [Terriglobia bacterium]
MALSVLHLGRIALAVFAGLALAYLALVLAVRGRHRGVALYRKHFSESRRERQFIAALGFYFAFAAVRFLTHAIRAGVGPFHNLEMGGRHIHHLVFGILLLLTVGYGWLLEIGSGAHARSRWPGRVMSLFYGIGAALTLDEFALWLNLRDVYWESQGRASVDAVLLFGSLLMIGVLGGRYVRALAHEALKPVRFAHRKAFKSDRASRRPPPP